MSDHLDVHHDGIPQVMAEDSGAETAGEVADWLLHTFGSGVPPASVSVVDSGGHAVGTAHWDAGHGAYVVDQECTVVVERTAHGNAPGSGIHVLDGGGGVVGAVVGVRRSGGPSGVRTVDAGAVDEAPGAPPEEGGAVAAITYVHPVASGHTPDGRTWTQLPRHGVVRLTNEVTTPFGIGHPMNSGGCRLALNGIDERGLPLNGDHELFLAPGESREWYRVPESHTVGGRTYRVVAIAVAVVGPCDDASAVPGIIFDTPSS